MRLHDAVRDTVDINFVVNWQKKTLLSVEDALHKQGFVSRLPTNAVDVFAFREEYKPPSQHARKDTKQANQHEST